MRKDIGKVLKKARAAGFEVRQSKHNHYRVTAPDGRIFGVSGTPSGQISLKRVICDFRKHGLEI